MTTEVFTANGLLASTSTIAAQNVPIMSPATSSDLAFASNGLLGGGLLLDHDGSIGVGQPVEPEGAERIFYV